MSRKVVAVRLKPYRTPAGIPGDFSLGIHEFNGLTSYPNRSVEIITQFKGHTLELENLQPAGAPKLVCKPCDEKIQIQKPLNEVLTFWALMVCHFRFPRGSISNKDIYPEDQRQLENMQPDNTFYPQGKSRICGYIYPDWLGTKINLLVTGLDLENPYDDDWEQMAYWEVIRALTSIHSSSIKELAKKAQSAFGWLYQQ